MSEKTKSVGHGIGWAVKHLQDGNRVARSGWNGKGMFLALVPGSVWNLDRGDDVKLSAMGELQDAGYKYRGSFVAMRAADGMLVPWLCSQTDLLATDWEFAAA